MRRYALIKNNVIDQIVSLEDANVPAAQQACDALIDIEDTTPMPMIGWLLVGNRLTPPSTPTIDANWIKNNKVMPIKTFVDDLLVTIIAENIYMGITQAGKSGAVLNVVNKKVEVSSAPFPVSLFESLTNLTLTVTIDVINYHLINIADYADLAPYIAADRLTNTKHKIQTFLGFPLT